MVKIWKKKWKKMKTIKKKNGVACSVVATLQWECNTKKEALKKCSGNYYIEKVESAKVLIKIVMSLVQK